MTENKMKYCPKCKTWKLFSEFYIDKSRKDGLRPYCKKCIAKIENEWYRKHKKEKIQSTAIWAKTDKGKQIMRQWRESNKGRKSNHQRSKRHSKTKKGKITIQRHIEKRAKMNWFELLPNPFAKSVIVERHHINNDYYIYLPTELHHLYRGYKHDIHIEGLKYIIEQIYREIKEEYQC